MPNLMGVERMIIGEGAIFDNGAIR